ncbi:hypothetical protein WR25_00647 [Diploscapter pachys]|uniref:Uncharacterized protein n=1 Tax=Diploscapter pachys TaxID=2018661 RepID=A0A2A2JIQ0_9BILA|nr:hypothetical protein WR25_00647 [Diploscapter pachys]
MSICRFFRQRRYGFGFEDPMLLVLDDAYRKGYPVNGYYRSDLDPILQEKRVTEREINDMLKHTWIG